MIEIPDEAVEAATKAYNAKKMHTNMSGDAQRYDMTAALSAAYPYLLAQITEGIAQKIDADADNFDPNVEPIGRGDHETTRTLRRTARNVRAYGKATS